MTVAATTPVVIPDRAGVAILTQAQGLPEEFRDHFFDVPLTVRVELNGKFLGDASILLSRDETVQLIHFSDVAESQFSEQERKRWGDALEAPRRLGRCENNCAGILNLYYSLENSMLSIITATVERDDKAEAFYTLPESGGGGLILRNSLNVVGGAGQQKGGRYALEALGSMNNWTTVSSLQLDQSSTEDKNSGVNYAVQRLILQRELNGRFVRAGLFTPSTEGVFREPNVAGVRPSSTIGFMLGSSDSLSVKTATASIYPVYVTANREAIAEIYRNGTLINSQPVQPGVQVIDSRQLPRGIYEVEIRLIEDGKITSRTTERIYKPDDWDNPEQRWRYSLYAGRHSTMFSSHSISVSGDGKASRDPLVAGLALNYLLHPRLVVGLSSQSTNGQLHLGSSLDWDMAERIRLYGSVYQSDGYGTGFDSQAILNYEQGSVVFSHNRAWLDNLKLKEAELNGAERFQGTNQSSALNLSHRISDFTSGTARIAHSAGANNGLSFDLGITQRSRLFDNDGNWRLSVFDRAMTHSGQRNRGFDLTLNIAIGQEHRRVTASAGTRATGQGNGRDQYASMTYQETFENKLVENINVSTSVDRYGVGVSGYAGFQNKFLRGDAYAQRSSSQSGLGAGLNLESTVALGANHLIASGDTASADAGMIVDVDTDMDDLSLYAYDSGGAGATLKRGRNFVPVTAYKAGALQYDFDHKEAPAAVIAPPGSSYHLNKGGVGYQQIKIMKTVTVMGRLLKSDGAPLKGAHVINHAGRSVSEADGFFVVEMSESTPLLDVRHKELSAVCQFNFDARQYRREDDTLMVGDVSCPAPLVQALPADSKS